MTQDASEDLQASACASMDGTSIRTVSGRWMSVGFSTVLSVRAMLSRRLSNCSVQTSKCYDMRHLIWEVLSLAHETRTRNTRLWAVGTLHWVQYKSPRCISEWHT